MLKTNEYYIQATIVIVNVENTDHSCNSLAIQMCIVLMCKLIQTERIIILIALFTNNLSVPGQNKTFIFYFRIF